ncbi:MAG: ABC transporter permease, partial [Terriglobales bacterium]
MRITRIEPHESAPHTAVIARCWDELRVDLRNASRMMWRSPGFTAIAALSLALGIGANTAIFSLVYNLMLRALPVQNPAQLVELLHRYPGEPHFNGFSWQAYRLFRSDNNVFSGLTAFAYETIHVRGEGLASQAVQGGFVDESFFPLLGIKPSFGRLIGPNDDYADNSAVVVVSWPFWKSRFNLDPAILGKQILVENVPVVIIGIAPHEFHGLQIESSQDIWLPMAMEASLHHPSYRNSARGWLSLVARLKQGVSRQEAQAEMAVLYDSTLEEQAKATNNPFLRRMKLEVEPAGAGLSALREEWAKPLTLLLALVALLLLIACTNLATLLLARGASREHELALRLSLGAGRFRLAKQVLTESLLLAGIGGLLGVLLANFGSGILVRIIVAERRPGPPLEFHVQTDWHVLAFTAVTALLTGFLFGVIPALRAM